MMGIAVPETCWAYKKHNKIINGIYLVFCSSVMTMMHGPANIKMVLDLQFFFPLHNSVRRKCWFLPAPYLKDVWGCFPASKVAGASDCALKYLYCRGQQTIQFDLHWSLCSCVAPRNQAHTDVYPFWSVTHRPTQMQFVLKVLCLQSRWIKYIMKPIYLIFSTLCWVWCK